MRVTPTLTPFALVCLLVLVNTSWALLPEMTREELIIDSELIVLATVQEVESAWADDHSQIYTYVRLEISDQFKGAPIGNQLVIQIPGGKVGEITQVTSDTPKNLQVGTEAVIHLFMKETGYYWVYGWEKGALTVENGTLPDYMMTLEQFRQLVERTLQ